MRELLLIILVIVLLVVPQFFIPKIRRPLLHYIRLSAGIAMLILVLLFGDRNIYAVVLLVIAAVRIVTSVISLIRYRRVTKV